MILTREQLEAASVILADAAIVVAKRIAKERGDWVDGVDDVGIDVGFEPNANYITIPFQTAIKELFDGNSEDVAIPRGRP